MQRLVGEVQNYAWGCTRRLAELRDEAESSEPEAEIWYGAHERAPSAFEDGSTLLEAIAADPEGQLGDSLVARFGPQLPFLVKLLAADSPLSIQAHPSAEQALAGFAAEDAAGIDAAAPNRCFRDKNPKPELVYAINPFEALVGFRPTEDTKRFLQDIGFDGFDATLDDGGPKATVEALLGSGTGDEPSTEVSGLIDALLERCRSASADEWQQEVSLLLRLHDAYPNDPGIGVAALLNYLVLKPGEALFLEAGQLHAYVSGLAVEVMANSDNVLRGGLTPKHIDVPTLLDIITSETYRPDLVAANSEGTLDTPSPEFAFTVHEDPAQVELIGPQVVVAIRGEVRLDGRLGADEKTLVLGPTEAAWLPAGERAVLNGTGLGISTTSGIA